MIILFVGTIITILVLQLDYETGDQNLNVNLNRPILSLTENEIRP